MFSCPSCGQNLTRKQSEYGVFWACEGCGHWLIGFSILRRTLEEAFFIRLSQEIRNSGEGRGPACPTCSKPMNQVSLGTVDAPLDPLFCKNCNVAWLSPEERGALPIRPTPSPAQPESEASTLSNLPPEAARLAALHEVELIGERAKREKQFDASHLPLWQKALAIIGLPIQDEDGASSPFPWFTAAFVLATTAASIYFFRDRRSPDYYGFIPREFDRYGGLTFFSNFFIHGSWGHLLGNMYFLFVFGRVVEEKIGWYGLLALLGLSTAFGNVLTLCFNPLSDIPHIGASGGIAGVLLFYGFAFPGKKIVFFMGGTYGLMMPRLIRIPAWAALSLWVVMQVFGASFQDARMSTISYSSHLGGLGAGLVFWLFWKWKNSGGLVKVEG